MEISLTLVSTKRTLLISLIGILILFPSAFISIIWSDLQPFLFIAVFVFGGLSIFLILKYYSRFVDIVIINQDYIRVGEKYTIHWDNIISYQYSNNGLLVGFVFRTIDHTYRLTGLVRGTESEKFKSIQDIIVKTIDQRNSNPNKNKILPYDFNTSKAGIRSTYITLAICIAGLLTISYLLILSKRIKPGEIFELGILCWVTIIFIRKAYMIRK